MVWLAPVTFLGVGFLAALVVVFRRKQSSSKQNSPKQSQISSELEQQIQEELSNLD
jgi:cytochrome c-type biogenesis protein CcmH/NrfF